MPARHSIPRLWWTQAIERLSRGRQSQRQVASVCEADDQPFGEDAVERCGEIEAGVLRDRGRRCRSEHEAVGERCSETEGAGIEPPPGAGIASPADLDAGTAAREIDRRHLALLVRLPDLVDRPAGGEIAHRRLQAQREGGGLFGWNRGERLYRQRGCLPHGRGNVEAPFEACDVRQIRQILARLKTGEEIREVGAVLDEATRMRRVSAQVFMRGVSKEALVDEAADDWERAFQDGAERRKGVIAVDSQSRRWSEPIASDGGGELDSVAAKHGSAKLPLQLKQRRHIGKYGPAPAHDALRPTGRPAREGWCPTRSRWARDRSAGALERGGPRPVAPPASRGHQSRHPRPRRRDGRQDGSRRSLPPAEHRGRRSGRTGSFSRCNRYC